MNIQIPPEWFSPGTIKKLHAHNTDPFQILKKLNDNTYIIDLPQNFGMSSTFNIENLVIIRVRILTPVTH